MHPFRTRGKTALHPTGHNKKCSCYNENSWQAIFPPQSVLQDHQLAIAPVNQSRSSFHQGTLIYSPQLFRKPRLLAKFTMITELDESLYDICVCRFDLRIVYVLEIPQKWHIKKNHISFTAINSIEIVSVVQRRLDVD